MLRALLEDLADKEKTNGPGYVAFVGDVSRTRYVDQNVLTDILCEIYELLPAVGILVLGQVPFDTYVEQYAEDLLLTVDVLRGDLPRMERLADRCVHGPEIAQYVDALIVFHRLTSPWDGMEEVVSTALNRQIPVIAVDREGEMYTWNQIT